MAYGAEEQYAAQAAERARHFGNGGMVGNSAIPTPGILNAQDEQDKVIQILHGTINTLFDRLNPILGPEGPSEANAKIDQPAASVLQRLGQATRTVQMAEARITDLMRRIQL